MESRSAPVSVSSTCSFRLNTLSAILMANETLEAQRHIGLEDAVCATLLPVCEAAHDGMLAGQAHAMHADQTAMGDVVLR